MNCKRTLYNSGTNMERYTHTTIPIKRSITMTRIIKPTLLLVLLTAWGLTSISQQSITDALVEIEANNPSIIALKSQIDYQKADARTQLTPPNPTLEGGRFPAVGSNEMKYTWGVSQSFEFPTVYAKRAQLAKTNDRYADALFQVQRQEVLLDVKYTILELIHKKEMLAELKRREAFARNMLSIMQKKIMAGEATAMDINYARLRVTEITQSVKDMEMQLDIMNRRMVMLNGNQPITIADSALYLPALSPDEAMVSECVSNDPRVMALDQMVELAHKNRQLVSHEGLPELIIGYESEQTDAEHFRGFHAGLSIPLWGNVGKNRAAKVRHNASLSDRQSQLEQIRIEYVQMYEQAKSAHLRLNELQKAYKEFNNLSLLNRALEAGQISIISYFEEVVFLYEITDKIMEMELEYAKYFAALHRFEL